MGSILNLITSPEWWFTAVIVAIPIGVFSAYLKDWLSSGLASVSSRYRVYRERSKLRQLERIELLASEPQLLAIEYGKMNTQVVAWVALILMSFALPAYTVLIRNMPEAAPLSFFFPEPTPSRHTTIFAGLLNLVLFVLTLFAQYRVLQQTVICSAARSKIHQEILRRRSLVPA